MTKPTRKIHLQDAIRYYPKQTECRRPIGLFSDSGLSFVQEDDLPKVTCRVCLLSLFRHLNSELALANNRIHEVSIRKNAVKNRIAKV